MEIYVITRGLYSDYHICAATADRKRAEELKRAYTEDCWGGEAHIETYKDGEGVEGFPFWDCNEHGEPSEIWQFATKEEINTYEGTGEISGLIVQAKDKGRARKKAQDMIAQYKAMREGI